MNAQRAYEYLNKSDVLQIVKDFSKGLIEALTGEPEKVEEPVKVGDRVRFSYGAIKDGIGEVCYVYQGGGIRVGFDAPINNAGWEWYNQDGYDHSIKRCLKYGWYVTKGNYTIIGRA